nr:hypothetical protein GCM10020093_079780 [Planobispora longispora]
MAVSTGVLEEGPELPEIPLPEVMPPMPLPHFPEYDGQAWTGKIRSTAPRSSSWTTTSATSSR